MCGRFVSSSPPEQLAEYFGAVLDTEALAASYNVAPTNDVYGVVADPSGRRHLQAFHWGLVPSWAKDVKMGQKLINARAETVADKPTYRSSFTKHRCLVPMDGFYEWQAAKPGGPLTPKGKPAKQPVFVHRRDGEPLAVAGLWAAWRDRSAGEEAPWLHSLTIITTDANATMAPIHDRMPVILLPEDWSAWLDPANHDQATLRSLLRPAPDDLLDVRRVSTEVNNVRSKGPELIEAVEGSAT